MCEEIVTPREDTTVLIARTSSSLTDLTEKERKFLRQLAALLSLPQTIRSAAIVSIDRMPLDASGKTNRQTFQNLSNPTIS